LNLLAILKVNHVLNNVTPSLLKLVGKDEIKLLVRITNLFTPHKNAFHSLPFIRQINLLCEKRGSVNQIRRQESKLKVDKPISRRRDALLAQKKITRALRRTKTHSENKSAPTAVNKKRNT
jgi:hypothetical protein